MAFYQSKQIVNNEPLVSADGATETIAIISTHSAATLIMRMRDDCNATSHGARTESIGVLLSSPDGEY